MSANPARETPEALAGAWFVQEWCALQNHHERYEGLALVIKLAGVALVVVALFKPALAATSAWAVCGLMAVLWLQEGILRTFQARLGLRILRVEALVAQTAGQSANPSASQRGNPPPGVAFQLHSEWLAARKTGLAALAEYAAHAWRPTVAFPYAVLLVGFMIQRWC